MYVCVCICTYVRTCVRMYVYICMYICMYVYIYMHMHIYIHTDIYTDDALLLHMPVAYCSTLSHSHATEILTDIHRPQTPKLYQLIKTKFS
jgi:hypothetical protein